MADIMGYFQSNPIVTSLALLGVMGALFGLLLAFAAKKFAVEVDSRVEEIEGALPGANCGACGFPGCHGLAESIVEGRAPVNACPVGKTAAAEKIAAIMGAETGTKEAKRAVLLCNGGKDECGLRFQYVGIQDCAAANRLAGGPKACEYGCLRLGNCARKCPVGAITMNERGLPEVGPDCTGCGICVSVCPRKIFTLMPAAERVAVQCRNNQRGPEVRKTCKVGCIACGICVKNCPENAITLENNLALIDQDKCTQCGVCVAKCPTKAIAKVVGAKGKSKAV